MFTWMYSNPELKLDVWNMTYPEGFDVMKKVERHRGDFTRVFVPVQCGETRDNHVSVANGLNLEEKKKKGIHLLAQILVGLNFWSALMLVNRAKYGHSGPIKIHWYARIGSQNR